MPHPHKERHSTPNRNGDNSYCFCDHVSADDATFRAYCACGHTFVDEPEAWERHMRDVHRAKMPPSEPHSGPARLNPNSRTYKLTKARTATLEAYECSRCGWLHELGRICPDLESEPCARRG